MNENLRVLCSIFSIQPLGKSFILFGFGFGQNCLFRCVPSSVFFSLLVIQILSSPLNKLTYLLYIKTGMQKVVAYNMYKEIDRPQSELTAINYHKIDFYTFLHK